MSNLALKLIDENKKTRAPFLDLGNCGLKLIPEELSELVWLEELTFASRWFDFDGKKWNERQTKNKGRSNRIISLDSTTSVFSKVKLLISNKPKPHALSRLTKLTKLCLNGQYGYKFDFHDLSPLSSLFGLQKLYVSSSQVSDLSPLSNLTGLKQLYISSTQVSDLNPLSSLTKLQQLQVSQTQVHDLTPLKALTELQQLYLSKTKVSDLSPLSCLIKLEQLYISNTQVSDMAPLSNLTRLQQLKVSDTKVRELRPLASLTKLQRLYAFNTEVRDLSPITSLTELQNLYIWNTQVSDLSPILNLIENGVGVKWSSANWEGKGIHIKNCPFTNPPTEIVKQGNAAILNYFREMDQQGVDQLYEAKMLIIGEGGAGKTSLLRRLYQTEKQLPEENESTKGIDIVRNEFLLKNGRKFRLNVWDFGGQEIYHATHQFFLTKRSLYVLLDDTRKDYKSVHDAGFKYWLEVVDLLGDHSPVLIFQNEKGGRSKTIDESGIKGKFNNVINFYRGNLEHLDTADELRDAIELFVQQLPHIGEELPALWISIRSEIEKLAEHQAYISIKDYFDIYGKYLEFDREKALYLSEYLHDLGVFLHFQDDPLLFRTVVLQNQWATEAVFKILDDEIVKAKGGYFDLLDYQRLWQDSEYADMHLELLSLMKKFELCFRLPDQTPETWLSPQLLSPSRPEKMSNWNQSGDLVLRYSYQFLPKGIVSRLIVRMHRFVIRPKLSWSSGVLFERNGTELLAEIPQKGGEIVLRARGSERKELLSVISSDLDALNETFHGLPDLVNKLVPCNCSRCSSMIEGEFFEQKRLLQRKQDDRLKVECPASYEDVSVLDLLDGIKAEHFPAWAEDEKDCSVQVLEAPEQTVKIFLASSSELREDRDEFELYFRQQNDLWREQGIYLKIIRWENFLDKIAEKGLQSEYNREVRECDIFVSLFFTKTGKYTEEEFDTAHQQFTKYKKPLIYTFFKNSQVNIGQIDDDINSLLNFKKKLSRLNHYHTNYNDIEHLKLQFKDQLEKLFKKTNKN